MPYRFGQIRELHVELTERCNAACPMCGRNAEGFGVNPNLTQAELGIGDFRRSFPAGFLEQLEEIRFCGNFGDPAAAADALAIVAHAREASPEARLQFHSNGALRPEGWWAELGGLLSRPGDLGVFAIDGLSDTSATYRQGTSFERAIANARAFVAAGGRARWAFLVFRHNEHQVDQARALARELGFESFVPKSTKRFFHASSARAAGSAPIRSPRTGEVTGALEPPRDPRFANASLGRLDAIAEAYGSFRAYLDRTPIRCRAGERGGLYVSARGHVFPCCWLGAEAFRGDRAADRSELHRLIAEHGSWDAIDARRRPIREIVEGPLFRQVLPEAWARRSVAEGRPATCARVCGSEFRAFEDQFLKETNR